MEFIDTHAHLYEADYGDEKVVERALEAGVKKIILPDVDSSTRDLMFKMASQYPENTFPTLGLHPTEVNKNWQSELAKFNEYSDKKVYAIGETGLDCYWSKEFLKEQIEAFHAQIEIAISRNLPIIIHSREATQLTFDVLSNYKGRGLRGVFHAFGGSLETFKEMEKYGDWYVGIGGVVTFKKASIGETIKDIPLERVLLETDAPWLAPTPHRGKRNESSYIPIIAEFIANKKNCSLDKVAKITTANAIKLFFQ